MKRLLFLFVCGVVVCASPSMAVVPAPLPVTARTLRYAAEYIAVPFKAAFLFQIANCNESTVQTAYNDATNGSTVLLPACNVTWDGTTPTNDGIGLSMTQDKGVTIQGNGIGSTNITDHTAARMFFLDASPGSTNRCYEFTGFTIIHGSVSKIGDFTFYFSGESSCFRLHHTEADYAQPGAASQGRWAYFSVNSNITGVIDHNEILLGNGSDNTALFIHHGSWGDCNGACQDGHGSWREAPYWGQSQFLFVEDNIIDARGANNDGAFVNDAQAGARYVMRFNTFYRVAGGLSLHGTESGGTARSPRAIEIYLNSYDTSGFPVRAAGNHRGGSFLAWGNTFEKYNALWGVRNNRSGGNFRWQATDGSNHFDKNDNTIYASGVADAGSSGFTLVDAGAGWTTNWAQGGYSVRDCNSVAINVCAQGGDGWSSTPLTEAGSWIVTSGSETLTAANSVADREPNFQPGDNYVILRVDRAFDAVGRGAGGLIVNNVTCGTGCTTWLNQVDEPSYQWDNKICGTENCTPTTAGQFAGIASLSGGIISGLNNNTTPHVINNRDVYQHNASIDTTVGVSVGTLAQRPSTCTAGVGFWATDQGDWNDGSNAFYTGQGTLYICTATDTWSTNGDGVTYEPFRYPHPDTLGGAATPAPTLTNVNPASGTRTSCAAGCEVILAGTGFSEAGFTGNISGSDVSIMCTDDSDAQATCDITVESDAATGVRQIAVTTDGGTSVGKDFEILAPTITAVNPPAASQDTMNLSVTITGTTFDGASEDVTFTPSTGLTADNESCSGTTCTFLLDVAADATPGTRTLTLETFDGTANTNFSINIVATGSPVITDISPDEGYRASIVPMIITGLGLTNGTLVENCTGLSFSGTTVDSDTQIRTIATITTGADLSTCEIYVQDGESLTFVNAANAKATTVTIPTVAVGDLMLMAAYGPVTGGCTVPSGWTAVNTDNPWATTTSWSFGMFWQVADATSESSGTWTSCTRLAVTIYRNPHGIPLGADTRTQNLSDATASITYGGVAFDVTNTTSWAVACAIHSDGTPGPQTAPTGMTTRTDTGAGGGGRLACHDTNGAATGFTGETITASSTSKNAVVVVEVKADASNPIQFTPLVVPGGPVGPLRAR